MSAEDAYGYTFANDPEKAGPMARFSHDTTLDEYQTFTDTVAIYPKDQALSYLALGLTGEAGEVADKVKKILRDKGGSVNTLDRYDVAKELGDVLWYVAQLARELGFELSDIADLNHFKLTDRQERGVLKGSGDSR